MKAAKSTYAVVDTMVLQKANAPITKPPGPASEFRKRLELLKQLQRGHFTALISAQLLHEYKKQLSEPRNDYTKTFFELLADPQKRKENYHKPWSARRREDLAKCRFPGEDEHVLRTAFMEDNPSTIYTEEKRMLKSEACVWMRFRVQIRNPVA